MSRASDAQSVLDAQAGQNDAFEALYTRYFDRLYDFVVRTTRDRHRAADVVQDTFLKAHQRIGQLRNPETKRQAPPTTTRSTWARWSSSRRPRWPGAR